MKNSACVGCVHLLNFHLEAPFSRYISFLNDCSEFDFSHGIAENGLSFWCTNPVLQQPMSCCCFLYLFLLLLGGLCLLDTEMLSSFMSLFYRGNLKVSKSTNTIFWVSFLTWIVCSWAIFWNKLSSKAWVWLFWFIFYVQDEFLAWQVAPNLYHSWDTCQ